MTRIIPKEAGAFFLQGSRDAGILLVHGYTGAPAEMRMLGNYLQAKGGYTVLGVCLAGHCATVEALEQTTWQDWYKAVEDGVKKLHQHCRHIYIAGQSMGGLLAILLRYFIPRLYTGQHSYNVPEEYMQGYTEMPTKPVPSLLELIELCKKEYLGKIKIPTLIVQGNADHTVKPESATYIYEHLKRVPDKQKELLWLPEARHVVTLDDARETVYEKCLEFIEKQF